MSNVADGAVWTTFVDESPVVVDEVDAEPVNAGVTEEVAAFIGLDAGNDEDVTGFPKFTGVMGLTLAFDGVVADVAAAGAVDGTICTVFVAEPVVDELEVASKALGVVEASTAFVEFDVGEAGDVGEVTGLSELALDVATGTGSGRGSRSVNSVLGAMGAW